MASPERRRVVESAYAAMPGLKRRARCLAPIGCLHCRCDKGGGLRQAASCLRLRQGGPPMKRHPNARVAPRGREALVSRVRAGERVSDAARQMGAGRQTASKRLARDRLGEGAADRSSRPPRIARAPPPRPGGGSSCMWSNISRHLGMLTFFQPKTSYAASPSDIPYWAGLIPPDDTLMRFSFYRSMYSPGASMNRPVDQPFQSRP